MQEIFLEMLRVVDHSQVKIGRWFMLKGFAVLAFWLFAVIWGGTIVVGITSYLAPKSITAQPADMAGSDTSYETRKSAHRF